MNTDALPVHRCILCGQRNDAEQIAAAAEAALAAALSRESLLQAKVDRREARPTKGLERP
jgi:hypothetical protein